MRTTGFNIICSAVLFLSCQFAAWAQQPVLTLEKGGSLSWTNAYTNGTYTLQWAPDLSGSWHDWSLHTRVTATNESMTIDVPMYFRLQVDTNHNHFVPPKDKVLMVAGSDINSLTDYVAATDLVPGGFMMYTSVQQAQSLTNPYSASGAGLHHGQFLVDTYTNSILQIGLYMVGALDDVNAGVYDGNIDVIGNWIKSTARPVYLRIGYEFDADWCGYNTNAYIQAYRRIVDRYRDLGVDNVSYVWHSWGNITRHDVMDWYPGDAYVDWVSVSVFGNPYGRTKPYVDRIVEIADELNKPLMVGEASPHGRTATNGVTSWTEWYADVFQWIEDNDAKVFCYINRDWDAPEMWQFNSNNWGDCRIQSDPDVFALWMHNMTNRNFMHASTNLFDLLEQN